MNADEVRALSAVLEGLAGSLVEKLRIGPAGVHVQIRMGAGNGLEECSLDLLCCGRMLLIGAQPALLVETSNYIDQEACGQIPSNVPIEGYECDPALGAVVLTFEDQRKLVMQAMVRDGECYGLYVSRWSGAPYCSERLASVAVEDPGEK